MNEISITAWVMFGPNIVTPVSVAVTSLIQSRPKAKPTHWTGIRVAATMSSPVAWRAAHQAAFRWSRFDLIGVCGAALICLLLLRAAPSSGVVARLGRVRSLRLLSRLARTQHMAGYQGDRGGRVTRRGGRAITGMRG